MRFIRRIGKRVGVDHFHAVNDGKVFPDVLVDEAVYRDLGIALLYSRDLRQLNSDAVLCAQFGQR